MVFAGEVVIVAVILVLTRQDPGPRDAGRAPSSTSSGVVLSAAGLGLAVFGVLRSGEWGWVLPKPGAPSLLGLSPTVWLVLAGLVVLRVFFWWERRLVGRGRRAAGRHDDAAQRRGSRAG